MTSLLKLAYLIYTAQSSYGWTGALIALLCAGAGLVLFFWVVYAAERRAWKKAQRLRQKAAIEVSGPLKWKYLSGAFFHPMVFGEWDIPGHNEIVLQMLLLEIHNHAGPNPAALLDSAEATFETYRILSRKQKAGHLSKEEAAELLRAVHFIRAALLYRGNLSKAVSLADLQSRSFDKKDEAHAWSSRKQ
ncbi:MAG: hypothetical protein JNM27_19995 [Leptospirales bacterium]|nr:hypothetical protein [Leptospirales bacterium]